VDLNIWGNNVISVFQNPIRVGGGKHKRSANLTTPENFATIDFTVPETKLAIVVRRLWRMQTFLRAWRRNEAVK
jgi:hypothetical protein